jgi:hypothetical protein
MGLRARRAGFTLVEAIVALGIGLVAIVAILMIFFSIGKMSHVSDLSGALQDAALAMAIIQKDLTQAAQKPDPKAEGTVVVLPQAFQLLRAQLRPDGSVDGKLVVYQKEPTSGKHFRLRRAFGRERSLLPGVFRSVRFQQLEGAGGPFVRVTLRVSTHDAAEGARPPKASEEAVLSSLVRVMGPEMAGSKSFTWSFMSLLKLIPFLRF